MEYTVKERMSDSRIEKAERRGAALGIEFDARQRKRIGPRQKGNSMCVIEKGKNRRIRGAAKAGQVRRKKRTAVNADGAREQWKRRMETAVFCRLAMPSVSDSFDVHDHGARCRSDPDAGLHFDVAAHGNLLRVVSLARVRIADGDLVGNGLAGCERRGRPAARRVAEDVEVIRGY